MDATLEEALTEIEPTIEELIAATRLTRDLKRAATTLNEDQARYLVDLYYALQKMRIGAAAQVRSAGDEPNMLIAWTKDMYEKLETDVKSALEKYAESQVPGKWALSIKGIGPVLAAGLLAHIDITKSPTVGSLWRFGGYDPTVEWGKGQKRPWNARLHTLGWKIGQSFVKSSGRDGSFYGPFYRDRKLWETERNNEKAYAEQAARALEEKNYGKDTEAYKWYSMGMLPPAHIQARAERYAVKLFFSHLHAVMYNHHYKTQAPCPYVIQYGGHAHIVQVPNWTFVDANGKEFDAYRPYVPTDEPKVYTWKPPYGQGGAQAFTVAEWVEMKLAYGHRCAYCGEVFSNEELTHNHVVPSSRGGANIHTNIVPACYEGDHRKADRIWEPTLTVPGWPIESREQ